MSITMKPRHAASGTDQTDSVVVDIDANGVVTDVVVRSSLPDRLRVPSAMTAAFDEALTAAHANAYPPAEVPADGTPVRARRVQRPPRTRPLREIVEESQRDPHRATVARPRTLEPSTGMSQNQCVEVTLDRTGPTGEVSFDAGWLANAHARNLSQAIKEAFDAAYAARERIQP